MRSFGVWCGHTQCAGERARACMPWRASWRPTPASGALAPGRPLVDANPTHARNGFCLRARTRRRRGSAGRARRCAHARGNARPAPAAAGGACPRTAPAGLSAPARAWAHRSGGGVCAWHEHTCQQPVCARGPTQATADGQGRCRRRPRGLQGAFVNVHGTTGVPLTACCAWVSGVAWGRCVCRCGHDLECARLTPH